MAGNGKIRGITIELGADVSGITSGLKKANSSISQTQRELNDVNKLLKLDPTNTTLLAQKQELLAKKMEQTKEKLDQLKKLQDQMDGEGIDKQSSQYQALQREIIKTEKDMEGLNDEFNKGDGAVSEGSGNKLDNLKEKFGSLAAKIAIVGGAMVAFSKAALSAFNDIDEGLDEAIKKTGATGAAAEELKGIYNNVAGSVVGDFDEIGAAVGEVATRFGLTGQELEDLAITFQKFAYINGTDVSNSIDTVQKTMTAFGLETKDATKLLDVLTKVSQNTGIKMDTLQSGLVSNAEAFQEMGLDAYQAATFMGQLEVSGADVSQVLSGMNKALASSVKGGKKLGDALVDLQKDCQNATSSQEALQKVYDIFGKKSAPAVMNAIRTGKIDFQNLAKSTDILNASSQVLNRTYDQTIDGSDEMDLASKRLKISLGELGEKLAKILAPMVSGLVDAFKKISPILDSVIQIFGAAVDAISAVLKPLAPVIDAVFGTVAEVLGGIAKAITAVVDTIKNAIEWLNSHMPKGIKVDSNFTGAYGVGNTVNGSTKGGSLTVGNMIQTINQSQAFTANREAWR